MEAPTFPKNIAKTKHFYALVSFFSRAYKNYEMWDKMVKDPSMKTPLCLQVYVF